MTLGQLEFPVDLEVGDELSSYLEEDILSSSWYEGVFQALFQEGQESFLRDKIQTFFETRGLLIPQMTVSPVMEKDWISAVYQGFPPLLIGRFYVYGSHIQEPPPAGLIPLHIEAATAFGSGQHESTEGCLTALSQLSEKHSFKAPLDMGCGSGILAIGMAVLWHVPVVACDNDAEAVRVTFENAEKNKVASLLHVEVSEGFAALKGRTFDIITANILADPLCQMAKDLNHALMPGGRAVLSGLLNRQAPDVIGAYAHEGITLAHQIDIGEWSTLIMEK